MEIEKVFIEYLKAFYSKNFEKVYSLLYEEDIEIFYQKVLEIAKKMDEFGETDLFLKKFNLNSLDELTKLSSKEFTISIVAIAKVEVGEKEFNKIIKGIKITNIENATFISKVHYEYPLKLYDKWIVSQGCVEMIKTKGLWKILFKSGMETGFSRFHDEIDRFHSLKLKDNVADIKHEGDLVKFTNIGFKDCTTGKIIFEPRFKDAGDFSEGLAAVQIIKKYGYINLKGELAIKPQFIYANEFSEKLASVKMLLEGKEKWGFIDKKGSFKIEAIYDETRNFKDGLCGVKLNEKWGFINKKGDVIIPFEFDYVEDFSFGTAFAEIENEDAETTRFLIDKKGKIKEIE